MELSEIQTTIEQYETMLAAEYNASAKITITKEILDRVQSQVLAEAHASGLIDGKNADTRKRQTSAIISENALISMARDAVQKSESDAAVATIQRKGQEALIGLTKAWLYSQSGIK